MTKSPKVYWRDSGLLHSLLGAVDDDSFLSQPWLGASGEGFVIEQILGLFEQRGLQAGAYYLRTSDRREIDLVLDLGSRLWAIEIKLTSAPGPSDMEKLNRHADLIKADQRILISRTARNTANGRQTSCNLAWFAQAVEDKPPDRSGDASKPRDPGSERADRRSRRDYFFGVQFWITVIGTAAASPDVTLMRNRPSGATSY